VIWFFKTGRLLRLFATEFFMRLTRYLFLPIVLLGTISCASKKLTPEQAIATAYRYTQVEWMPEARHIRHGNDSNGIPVHTPDRTLIFYEERGGWWMPGLAAKSVPYKWGGFDTPESFLRGIKEGRKAGDVATRLKRKMDDAVVSQESVGIDCSGFICRCWGLPKAYSTDELPQICDRLGSWDELRKGDILLKNGHVILFEKWGKGGTEITGYEAGPKPFWRVNACGILKSRLVAEGYSPWRYRGM
jgi:hypothetical protein